MRIIGLIPARGGSKGIPRKNLQNIHGIPLVARKIMQAKESLCNEIWVSTEDSEIRDLALKFDARVIDRPKELSQDNSGTDVVIFHAIKYLNLNNSDLIIILQPTSPLIKLDSINNCISKLLDNPFFGSILTIKESHLQVWTSKDNSVWQTSDPNMGERKRRQELDNTGWETGGCYALRVRSILLQDNMIPSPVGTISVNYLEALDIDTTFDLDAASDSLNFLIPDWN